MNYGDILRRALSISWRHPYLWLLALLAGEGGAISLSQNGGGRGGRYQPGAAGTPAYHPDAGQVTAWLSSHAALLWTAGAVLAGILIVLFVISAVAQGALVRAVAEHDAERPYGFGAAWRAGVATFWPLLRLKLLVLAIAAASLLVLFSLGLFSFAGFRSGDIGLGIAGAVAGGVVLLLAIPVGIVIGVLVVLAARAVVLDGRDVRSGLRWAWDIIRRRTGRVALIWVLAVVAGIVGGIGVAIGEVIVAVPLAAVVVGAYLTGGSVAAIAVGVVLGLVWVAAALVLLGAVAAYLSSLWTLAYRRFDEEQQPLPAAQPLPA